MFYQNEESLQFQRCLNCSKIGISERSVSWIMVNAAKHVTTFLRNVPSSSLGEKRGNRNICRSDLVHLKPQRRGKVGNSLSDDNESF